MHTKQKAPLAFALRGILFGATEQNLLKLFEWIICSNDSEAPTLPTSHNNEHIIY
jgi:hypothetical protein